jgi:hypothetical protein
MAFLSINLLIGMVLGQRFKVLVLLPALTFVLVAAVCLGISRNEGLWPTAGLAAAAIASLQIGYFAGICIRHTLAAARISGRRTGRAVEPRPISRSAPSAL